MPQPNLVPVSRSSSRRTHSRGIAGSASISTVLPFTLSLVTDPSLRLFGIIQRGHGHENATISACMAISVVGIVGAGTMGQGIAITCAAVGLDVLIAEQSVEVAKRCRETIGEDLDRDIAKWRRTESEKKAILARIRTVDGLPALEAAHLDHRMRAGGPGAQVLAVPRARPDLPARGHPRHQHLDALGDRDRDAHQPARPRDRPALPASRRRECPWSRWCAASRPRTTPTSSAREFVRVLGKTAVEVFEYPGYVTTRVMLPFLNEAMHVVMEGVATRRGRRHGDEAGLRPAQSGRWHSPTAWASTR